MEQLSLSARPKNLDQMVGQRKIVAALRGHVAEDRIPKALLFTGPKGNGKTSICRIIGLSLQCDHQEEGRWGRPCADCYAMQSQFHLTEINCADITGIDGLRAALGSSDYTPQEPSSYRIFSLDEVHQLSASAQSLLLKYLEDSPDTTKWLLSTTNPDKLKDTLRSRCIQYQMAELTYDDILLLITALLKKIKSSLPPEHLCDALSRRQISSPRLVCNAVEKYAATKDPEEAAKVDQDSNVALTGICRSLVSGDWDSLSKLLATVPSSEARGVRVGVAGYLREMLLSAVKIDDRSVTVAEGIRSLARMGNQEDMIIHVELIAVLHVMCRSFILKKASSIDARD